MSHQNLNGKDAIEKLKEISSEVKTCMFVTDLQSLPSPCRPMTLQETDDEGNLWFLSSASSDKNFEIKEDNNIQLYFANNDKHQYLSVFGEAFIYRDKNTIEEKWSAFANAWFDGKDDPDVSVIRVAPKSSYYWNTKAGKIVTMLSFIGAAITGNKTNNADGVEGKISV